MDIPLFTTLIESEISRYQDVFRKAYEASPDEYQFWCMIDLNNNSNYRLVRRSLKGYIRTETFFELVRIIVSYNSQIRILKELGDAVLLYSPALRSLLECVMLMNEVAKKLNSYLQHDDIYPFSFRSVISYGITKRLTYRGNRFSEDFIGEPIDQLSRLISVKSDRTNVLIQDKAYENSTNALEDYSSIISFSHPKALSLQNAKNMITEIYYREVFIDANKLFEFDRFFWSWNTLEKKL